MTRPTVSHARAWQPEALRRLADAWDDAARLLAEHAGAALAEVSRTRDTWTGAAAEAARAHGEAIATDSRAAARSLVIASVAASDGAEQIADARSDVLDCVAAAHADGFAVTDDGVVSMDAVAPPLLVGVFGGDTASVSAMLDGRAARMTAALRDALDRLGAADAHTAAKIADAFASAAAPLAAATVPAGTQPVAVEAGHQMVASWPTMSQDRIAEQVTAMTADQRRALIAAFPVEVGNTDGVPWDMRVAANRVNIAAAIVAGGGGADAARRTAFYRTLLSEIDDPAGTGRRVDRQILAFDPNRQSLVELNGNLSTAHSVAVLVPGMNTTIEGSAANNRTVRRFVSATGGDVAAISYLGGPFPRGHDVARALIEAADPRYALDMAPRLVAFSEDVDRTVDATGRTIPVTYLGHSYGGSILGTAEALGLTADRTLYIEAAGAGVGVDDPGDWHNRNPQVARYSITAPGDFIGYVQGLPGGPHGADPDEMPGVTRLATGRYDDGGLVAGWHAHSGVLDRPSEAWRNILAVITGDRAHLRVAS